MASPIFGYFMQQKFRFLINFNTEGLSVKQLITHAVIPAAGKGTRFLPITRAVAKELLPILNEPAIQYIAKELVDSGITDFHIIINDEKQAIRDYFTPIRNEETVLPQRANLYEGLQQILSHAHFSFVNQDEQKGLGHAILMAEKQIPKDVFFAAALPDDLLLGDQPCMQLLISYAQKYEAVILAVQEVRQDQVSSYGVIAIAAEVEPGVFTVSDLVEKPQKEVAPSTYAIIGRYVLPHAIFSFLHKTTPGSGGEIQLTDAIRLMVQAGYPVMAVVVPQKRFDLGNPQGWLAANLFVAEKK